MEVDISWEVLLSSLPMPLLPAILFSKSIKKPPAYRVLKAETVYVLFAFIVRVVYQLEKIAWLCYIKFYIQLIYCKLSYENLL